MLAERDPGALPRGELGAGVVIEPAGRLTSAGDAGRHLAAGTRKVIISAPARDEGATIVTGVDDGACDAGSHRLLCDASCTTNCVAPPAKVLADSFGIRTGLTTTIHACAGDQVILDLPHEDLRRARAAAQDVIPATAGAAKATALVPPELTGKLDGPAVRVPVPGGSVTGLVVQPEREVTVGQVNAAHQAAAAGPLAGYLHDTAGPVVCGDVVGTPYPCTFDSQLTTAAGDQVRVAGWYDNERGCSSRLVDLCKLAGSSLPARS